MLCHRLIPALAVLVAAMPAAAQDSRFFFSTVSDDSVAMGGLIDKGSSNIDIRPNTFRELNLFVKNEADDPHQLRVQMLDAKGKVVTEATLRAAKKAFSRVKFAKPMPPMPAAPAVVVVPPAATPVVVPKEPPPPPGVEIEPTVTNKVQTLEFKLRVYDDTAIDAALEAAKAKPETKNKTRDEIATELAKTDSIVVSILDPKDYIKLTGPPTYQNYKSDSLLEMEVIANDKFLPGTPCLIEMVFPPQPNIDVTTLGAGVYRKTIAAVGDKVKMYATGLPLRSTKLDTLETVYLNIDGVPRVYTFQQNLRLEKQKPDTVVELPTPVIRVIEGGMIAPPVAFVSQPKERYPLRVEVDGSLNGFDLTLSDLKGEIVRVSRPTAQHKRAWLDPVGEAGGIRVESRVADWVVPLDTRDVRGRFTLTAILTGEANAKKFLVDFILDDTPPPVDKIKIDGISDKQYRGRPMKVNIFAEDRESGISKVAVFLGRPAPDGKLPEPPILVQAVPPPSEGLAWVAQIPIPADKKGGKEEITTVVTNGVGQSTAKTIIIQLLDPPTGGKIKGVVKLGEFGKGADGADVILKDGDGKEKDATKTNMKGEFEFTDVLPGSYAVIAAKPDSAFGTRGATSVRVKAGETAVADVVLTRKPK